MPWTHEQKVQYLLLVPWTIVPDVTPEGDRLLRVGELPAAVGSGVTDEELAKDFWESLEATLDAYVDFDDPIPLPAGVPPLPWTVAAASAPERQPSFMVDAGSSASDVQEFPDTAGLQEPAPFAVPVRVPVAA